MGSRGSLSASTSASVTPGSPGSPWSPGPGSPEIQSPVLDRPVAFMPPYNVILHDDDDHTYAYVIELLMVVFGFPPHKGFVHAQEVDASGCSILITTTREHAELKQEQIHGYGADPRLPHCAGSMTATVEPAF